MQMPISLVVVGSGEVEDQAPGSSDWHFASESKRAAESTSSQGDLPKIFLRYAN